jgi:hypothetical protein
MGFELKGLGTLWVCLGFFLWVGFGTSCVLKGVLHSRQMGEAITLEWNSIQNLF